MSTSGNSDFTITKRQLIERAYRMVGALRSGEAASAAMMKDANHVLNGVIRELDRKKIGLWVMKNSTFTTIAGQAAYTSSNGIPTDILMLESALYVVNSADERHLERYGYTDYEKINDKTHAGDPTKIFIDEQLDLSLKTIKFYPTPNQAKTVKLRYRRRSYDFDSDSDNPDFPGEYFSMLAHLLASELSEEYPVDKDKVVRLGAKGDTKLRDMKAGSSAAVDNPKRSEKDYF